jgi:GTP cyclohydrolase II
MAAINAWLENAQAEVKPVGRPLVTLSYAQSLDGCVTDHKGHPYILSGPEAHVMTHGLRARHDAILVGVGTVIADNPHLTVRHTKGMDPRPVILDTHLRSPMNSRLLERRTNLPWIACGPNVDEEKVRQLAERDVILLTCKLNRHNQVDLVDMLSQLYESGIRTLMIEGGAEVITSFIESRLVDLAVITIAPVWLGGLHALESGTLHGCPLHLDLPQSARLGKDMVFWGRTRFGEK